MEESIVDTTLYW